MNSTTLTITLPRTDLIATLVTKKDEIVAEFDAKIQEVKDRVDSIAKTTEALTQWHLDIAALLTSGEAKMRASGEAFAVDPDATEIPEKPSSNSLSKNKRELKWEIEGLEQEKQRALGQVDATLRLLNLATDTDVSIPVGEYERMLNVYPGRRHW